MRTEAEAKKYYTVDTANADRCHFIRSFERNSDMPIAFIHYKHGAHAGNGKSYKRQNDFSTIFIFVRGGVDFIFEETLYSPNFGEVILVREQESFSVFGSGDQFDYYEIDFPPGFLDRIYENSPFSSLFLEKAQTPILSLGKEQKEQIFSVLKNAEEAENDLLCYSYLVQLSHLLCHGKTEGAKKKKISETLASAIEFMNCNHAHIAGANEIAAHCGVSTTYLARLFQNTLSCTTTEYLNRLRISHAKELLLQGLSATEACYGAGFGSYTYFISKFKETVGVTPAKFK